MGQKSRASAANVVAPGLVDKRKKDKTVHLLDGLVADLARRTQSAIDGSGPNQHLESIRAIHRLLIQIQKLELPFVNQQNIPDVSARLKVLEDWLKQQGVEIEGLKLEGKLPEGAGVVAQQRFEKGQMLCTVPAHVMMTTATAIRSKDDVGFLFKSDPILRQMPTLILALHLLFEKHRSAEDPSNWAGYIASLPGQGAHSDTSVEETDNFVMPLAFSLETIEALRGTAVLVEMHKAVRNYARQYAHVRLLLRQRREHSLAIQRANTWFTWAEFRWAASIVMTRQNPIPGTPDMEMGQALALIPFLDMFNHEEGEITCHFAVTQQQMELTAKRNFEPGDQVYISYGYRPNSALLLYSGFVPDYNSKDRVKVPVELSPSDPLYSKKVALLKWLELPASGWLELFHDGTPSPELATWIKVAIMQDLSVVTENLRAAIASRAQETAAILQYKAALREAEEKARNGFEKADVQTSAEATSTLTIDDVSETKNGDQLSPNHETTSCAEGGTACSNGEVVGNIVVHGKSNSVSDAKEKESSETSHEEHVQLFPEASVVQEKLHNASGVGENGNSSGDVGTVSDDRLLGEHLFPAEALLLAEICRLRISGFGNDMKRELNARGEELPIGMGGSGLLGAQKSIQSKSPIKKELEMALKIRRQEQLALLRAIDRGARHQRPHSNHCGHCC